MAYAGNIRKVVHPHQIGAILIGAWIIIACMPIRLFAQNALSYEERICAQEAIERVYYAHRIWPKENPGPKPPFEQIMSRSIIEARVDDYLRKSTALEQYWNRPLTAKQLQAEIDRLTSNTKNAEMLIEIFAALNNNATKIAECLARPVLANRLIRDRFAFDTKIHDEARAAANSLHQNLTPGNFQSLGGDKFHLIHAIKDAVSNVGDPSLNDEQPPSLDEQAFREMNHAFPPVGTISPIIETADAFIIRWTSRRSENSLEGGVIAIEKRGIDQWLAEMVPVRPEPGPMLEYEFQIPAISAAINSDVFKSWQFLYYSPIPRSKHFAVWTGKEMIVWGGYTDAGGRYNPELDQWKPTSTATDCPYPRDSASVIWTGSEMIIWGGHQSGQLNTGACYDPASDSWRSTSTGAYCPSGRYHHSAVWTGTEMVIWGGWNLANRYLDTGGRYDPITNTWSGTSTAENCPSPRGYHSAVWTGNEMLIWGGTDGDYQQPTQNPGGRYNPTSDSWSSISTGANCPSGKVFHVTVWTGSEMIVWGGGTNTGARYNPGFDSWSPTATAGACPSPRYTCTAVWTGEEMIIWGGGYSSQIFRDGARYNPLSDSWLNTSTGAGCPSARGQHSAIWTGREMIVWGGGGSYDVVRTGGRYDPMTDIWVPTFVGDAPSPRSSHTVIWTGAELVVWGGYGVGGTGNANFDTGGRYDPALDSWSPTSLIGRPAPRMDHTAIWTGTEMIVWGGAYWTGQGSYICYRTGGRYNPASDSWISTPVNAPCPSERRFHSAVWTGTEMIVWGGSGGTANRTGGRYDPASNIWLAMSTGTNCPTARLHHTAVWTGSEMIVWGGYGSTTFKTGGRYNPSSNSWTATSTGTNCPSARYHHVTAWTGDRMFIWGGWSEAYSNTGGLYNPSSNQWTSTSTLAECPSGRNGSSAVWTGTEIIVWGGYANSYPPFNTGGRYSPRMDAWRATPINVNTPSGRSTHAVWASDRMIIWDGSPVKGDGGIYRPDLMPVIVGSHVSCDGSPVRLSTDAYIAYQWQKDGSDIPGANAQFYTAMQSGTYTVQVTDPDGRSGVSPEFIIYPTPSPTITGSFSACATLGTRLSTQSYVSYQWGRDGMDIPSATSDSYVAKLSGNYFVRVVDSQGCTAQSDAAVVTIKFCTSDEVSSIPSGVPLKIVKDASSSSGYYIYFEKIEAAAGYNLYEGMLEKMYSHSNNPSNRCAISFICLGATLLRSEFLPSADNNYYLITAFGDGVEGPSGFASTGLEIPTSESTCAP